MKKTVSMLLAILVAAITVCTFATSAFADTTTTVASNGITDPNDGRLDPTTTTTKAATTATTAAPTTTVAPTTTAAATTTEASATTAASTTAKETTTEKDDVVTLPSGVTVIDEGSTKAPTTKKPTTKKPAANVSTIPSTGSSVAAPVIALLALAAGTVAVVKTKKDN